ncbi:hypothetical protein AAC387_Pa03g3434 [Persea americana]
MGGTVSALLIALDLGRTSISATGELRPDIQMWCSRKIGALNIFGYLQEVGSFRFPANNRKGLLESSLTDCR